MITYTCGHINIDTPTLRIDSLCPVCQNNIKIGELHAEGLDLGWPKLLFARLGGMQIRYTRASDPSTLMLGAYQRRRNFYNKLQNIWATVSAAHGTAEPVFEEWYNRMLALLPEQASVEFWLYECPPLNVRTVGS